MADYPLCETALQAVSPSDSLLVDSSGNASVMVRIPKFHISDIIAGGSDTVHPAFLVNGQEVDEIYISKYQNIVFSGAALSLPLEAPAANISFDAAMDACTAKGSGWHLMTRAEWAAIALWCRKYGCLPKGNNGHGKDATDSDYEALPAAYSGEETAQVRTGSGPLPWSHNSGQDGIFDLNGNVYEWLGGYRTVDGEIQILADNNAADTENSQLTGSVKWMALLENGTLVAPGTEGTLKWDYSSLPTGGGTAAFTLSTTVTNRQAVEADGYGSVAFEALTTGAGVTVPEILKALAIFPSDAGDHGADKISMRNIGERMGAAGGDYNAGTDAGVFCLNGALARAAAQGNVGFRCAYVKIPGAV